MRALAFSVSGSETYTTEPVLEFSAIHSGLWQVFELICFRVRRPMPAGEPQDGDHRKRYSSDCCGNSRFVRPAGMACFRIGKSSNQEMRDIHIRTQKLAGKSVPETTS